MQVLLLHCVAPPSSSIVRPALQRCKVCLSATSAPSYLLPTHSKLSTSMRAWPARDRITLARSRGLQPSNAFLKRNRASGRILGDFGRDRSRFRPLALTGEIQVLLAAFTAAVSASLAALSLQRLAQRLHLSLGCYHSKFGAAPVDSASKKLGRADWCSGAKRAIQAPPRPNALLIQQRHTPGPCRGSV